MENNIIVQNYPKLTVGLIAYNHEAYIEDCFKSILKQKFSDFEIVILNDASTDNTDKIIREYQKKFKEKNINVTYICHKKNSGNISKNVNEIIRKAKGDYYWELSCDDMFSPNAFESLVKVLNEQNECDVAYSNMMIVDDSCHYEDVSVEAQMLFVTDQCEGVQVGLFDRLMFKNCVPTPGVLFRRSVFEKYGLHDENLFSEDYEYWLRLSRTVNFYFLNQPLVYYRKSETSVTNFSSGNKNKKLMKMMQSNYSAKEKYFKYISNEYKKVCLKEFFEKYYKDCNELSYKEGLDWIQEHLNKEGISIDERQLDYKRISERLGIEAEILYNWVLKKENPYFLQQYFNKNNVSSVAIYGYSRLGKLLEEEIKKTTVKLAWIIDRKGVGISANVPVVQNVNQATNIDMIIVAPIGVSSELIHEYPNLTIVDIKEIVI